MVNDSEPAFCSFSREWKNFAIKRYFNGNFVKFFGKITFKTVSLRLILHLIFAMEIYNKLSLMFMHQTDAEELTGWWNWKLQWTNFKINLINAKINGILFQLWTSKVPSEDIAWSHSHLLEFVGSFEWINVVKCHLATCRVCNWFFTYQIYLINSKSVIS